VCKFKFSFLILAISDLLHHHHHPHTHIIIIIIFFYYIYTSVRFRINLQAFCDCYFLLSALAGENMKSERKTKKGDILQEHVRVYVSSEILKNKINNNNFFKKEKT